LQQGAASAVPLGQAAVVCVLIHVGVAQASTRVQPAIVVMNQMRSSTKADGTGRWTARRRLILAPNVKTTISLCPRAGRWQPTMPIHDTSLARTSGEQQLCLFKMDMDTMEFLGYLRATLLPKEVGPGVTGLLFTWLRLGQRTRSIAAIS
jgi:hypothetical protein